MLKNELVKQSDLLQKFPYKIKKRVQIRIIDNREQIKIPY